MLKTYEELYPSNIKNYLKDTTYIVLGSPKACLNLYLKQNILRTINLSFTFAIAIRLKMTPFV